MDQRLCTLSIPTFKKYILQSPVFELYTCFQNNYYQRGNVGLQILWSLNTTEQNIMIYLFLATAENIF